MFSKKKLLIVGSGYITKSFLEQYSRDYKFYLLSKHTKKSTKNFQLVASEDLGKHDFEYIIFGSSISSFKTITNTELQKFLSYVKSFFQTISKKKLTKIIYLSSSALYGLGHKEFSEKSKIRVASNYQKEKNEIESLLLKDNNLKNLTIIFRISNPYGSICGVESPNGFINIIFNNCKLGKETIVNSKNSIRDFIHIKDVISCINYALCSEFKSGVYNLGSGEPSTLESVICEAKKTSKVWNFNLRNEDETVSILDIKKLKKTFKSFQPILLEKGIKDFYMKS